MERTQLNGVAKAADGIARVVAAGILAQTLYFKFTGAPESVFIFTTVGMEPFGRWASGVTEAVAAGLLLAPAFPWLGALVALGVMAGAIASHLFILGVEVQGDGGLLFGLALAVAVCSLVVLFLRRADAIAFATARLPFLRTVKT